MNQQLKEAKRVIRSYWPQWSDAALADAYAAAEDGKMPFHDNGSEDRDKGFSCLVRRSGLRFTNSSTYDVCQSPLATAYVNLGDRSLPLEAAEACRQVRIRPMLLAEMRRRERARQRAAEVDAAAVKSAY